MSFLLHSANTFTRVDRNKQNLFYQTYTSQGLSRPISLLINCTNYSATIDGVGQVHVVAKNAKGQTHYFSCSATPTKQLLFEDSPSTYFFNNLQLTYFKDKLHLFYTATNPTTKTTTLLHRIFSVNSQNVETLAVETLIQNFQDKEFSVVSSSDTLFIVFSDQKNVLELKYLKMKNDKFSLYTLLLSEFPIISFECSIIEEKINVIYLQNKYGLNELMYFNIDQNLSTHVCNIESIKGLSLFKYINFLWINYATNEALYTILSIDDGKSFSTPVLNSLQKNIHYLNFFSLSKKILQTNNLFVAISNNIQICTVYSMDTAGLHPNALPNNELDLFLDAIKFKFQQQYLKEYEMAKTKMDTKIETISERVTPNVAYVESAKPTPNVAYGESAKPTPNIAYGESKKTTPNIAYVEPTKSTPNIAYVEPTKSITPYSTFDEALLKPPAYSKQPFVLKDEPPARGMKTIQEEAPKLSKPQEMPPKVAPAAPKEESLPSSGPKDFKSLAQSFMQNYNTFDAQPLIKPD
ncbi:hypothetical protein AN640_04175 [Candidatus Epulonipiscium fishelsonii]|uniref:Uncharacterized protein n=2 Tax=Candidatus Epulonipiscium fishelsonii TaxID=77094 RepID=A0ACC8XIN2_9FIRM|nr:hypothetical protein AN640_06410 [Epulopiscium sp. SCG-D08WGA-EpuloA1]ONI45798.1 hypothetical protein AN640_04175 [Epulopiscium sp. SCG-D08WGA-EpuloA1]